MMISEEVWNRIEPEARQNIEFGLALLVQSGAIQHQLQILADRVASGSRDDSDEDLLKQIRQFRQDKLALIQLQELGESFKQQDKDNVG